MHGSSSASVSAPLTHAEVLSILFGIMLAMFLAALDQTIVATAMPIIGGELGDVEHISWIVTAYLLAATAVTPLYGKISDIKGRRTTMLIAIGIFVAGSIACALAPSMLALILARGLQGLGGGGLISLAQTIIADIVTPHQRGRYQGYIAGVFVTASLAGPVLGGVLAEHFHWSLIFWLNVPLGLAAFIMTNAFLRKLPRHERPHKLDIAGAVLMVTASTLLMLALTWGGVRYPWTSQPIIGLIAAAVVLWVGFFLRMRTAQEPFVPLSILSNQVIRNGTLAATFCMGTFIGLSIYAPIYLQAVYGLSAANSGLALIPLMAGTAVGASISGRLMPRVTHYKRLPTIGLSVSVCALAIIGLWPRELPLAVIEILFAATSIGLGSMLPVTTVSVQNAALPHQLGTTTGTMNFFRQLGGAVMVAAFGAIVIGSLPMDLHGASHESFTADLVKTGIDFAPVFRWVFLAAALALLVALTFLIVMEERPLRGKPEPTVLAE